MLCFLQNIISMFPPLGKSNMTRFKLTIFTNIFISTFQMEQIFTIWEAPPTFNMVTVTGFKFA